VRSVKFKEGPMHALQEEPIVDPPLLVDVVLSDSHHTSDSDHISDDDGETSDLDE
jgi:hypothetical protein